MKRCLSMILLIFLLVGCSVPQTPRETAAPSTSPVLTTPPAETDATIPETTEHMETTIPFEDCLYHAELMDAHYVHETKDPANCTADSCSIIFRYEGTDPAVYQPVFHMTLTLPEEWLEKVEIVTTSSKLYVISKEIRDAHRNRIKSIDPSLSDEDVYTNRDWSLTRTQYLLCIERIPRDDYNNPDEYPRSAGYDPYDNPVDGIFLYEDADYFYYGIIGGDELYQNNRWYMDTLLIEYLGEAAYNALLDGWELDYDMVRNMVQFDESE